MGARLRGLSVVVVVLAVGAFIGSTVAQWRSPPAFEEDVTPRTVRPVTAPDERVRVEVLNGGGVDGMARAATDHLRELGFDVVDYGNAASFDRDTSVVLDRAGRSDLARTVALALDIRQVRSEPDTTLYLEVTVILGRSWRPPEVPETGESRRARPAWWDIRRFFRRDESRPVGPEPGGTDEDRPGRMADPGEDDGTG